MEPKSLFEWRDIANQYIGFVASFWMLGAIGFRYGILRRASGWRSEMSASASSAAGIGGLGAALGIVSFLVGLLKRAESKRESLADALHAGGAVSMAQVLLLAALLLAFVLAWRRYVVGWPLAAISGVAFALRNVLAGRLGGMVNPLHVLGASLWLGTLYVLVVSGITPMLRPAVNATEREQVVATMVSRFSAMALASASLLGVTGVITAWTHLDPLSALWTTPYGYALIVKLCLVAVVAGLGAWNWRRVGPSLGTEGGALKIRRTASSELMVAGVVLIVTAVLVSLPSPKAPKRPHTPAAAASGERG